MKQIDINCDMGEMAEALTDGTQETLMRYISSANIACGGHAGDAHTIRATDSTSVIAILPSGCAALSDLNSIALAVLRNSSLTITSPLLIRTTTRSPRRIGAAGETTMMPPSR